MITQLHIFIIGAEKLKSGPDKGKIVKAVKRKIPLENVVAICVSSLADDFFVLNVKDDFDSVLENVYKTELITELCSAYNLKTGVTLNLAFTDCIKYTVKKKSILQSDGICELKFIPDSLLRAVEVKNNGRCAEIRVSGGLARDTRPENAQRKMAQSNKLKAPPNYNGNSTVLHKNVGNLCLTSGSANNLSSKNSLNNQQFSNKATGKFEPSRNNPMSADVRTYSSNKILNSGIITSTDNLNLATVAAKKKAPPPPPSKKIPICRAIFDYTGLEADELNLKKGDIVTIVSKADPGWWIGSLSGRQGVFPANYVEMC